MGLCRASPGGPGHREPARRGHDLEGRQAQAGGTVIGNADGSRHIVPMGYRESGEDRVIASFRPSTS